MGGSLRFFVIESHTDPTHARTRLRRRYSDGACQKTNRRMKDLRRSWSSRYLTEGRGLGYQVDTKDHGQVDTQFILHLSQFVGDEEAQEHPSTLISQHANGGESICSNQRSRRELKRLTEAHRLISCVISTHTVAVYSRRCQAEHISFVYKALEDWPPLHWDGVGERVRRNFQPILLWVSGYNFGLNCDNFGFKTLFSVTISG